MIICPNCKHTELSGALFCSQCGALIESMGGISTQAMQKTATNQLIMEQVSAPAPAIQAADLTAAVSLCVVDSGQILPLLNRDEFTLGRASEGQPISPDIDLAEFRAYEMGVSRLHASIRIENKLVFAVDLGSVNGTRLNGQKILPHKPCQLNHGDILTLGKLKLQILLRK